MHRCIALGMGPILKTISLPQTRHPPTDIGNGRFPLSDSNEFLFQPWQPFAGPCWICHCQPPNEHNSFVIDQRLTQMIRPLGHQIIWVWLRDEVHHAHYRHRFLLGQMSRYQIDVRNWPFACGGIDDLHANTPSGCCGYRPAAPIVQTLDGLIDTRLNG